MKRKFSTLLTAGLLIGGALFSSAYAQNLPLGAKATEIKNGDKYFLVQKDGSQCVLGFTDYNEENSKVTVSVVGYNATATALDDATPYIWTVNQSEELDGKYVTTFTNLKTGKQLLVKKDGSDVVTEYTKTNTDVANGKWAWAGWTKYGSSDILSDNCLIKEKTAEQIVYLNNDKQMYSHEQQFSISCVGSIQPQMHP